MWMCRFGNVLLLLRHLGDLGIGDEGSGIKDPCEGWMMDVCMLIPGCGRLRDGLMAAFRGDVCI